MPVKITSIALTLSRLKTVSSQYLTDGVIPLDDKLLITRDQFNQLANDALMNWNLNHFFAEGVKIMRHNDIPYNDINLINLFLKKNNIHQVEIV